ncbi:MAG: hypothetical protein RBT53_11365, partial [Azonexus sp.]|nr:hypothetical protein [Azonexus sp.]
MASQLIDWPDEKFIDTVLSKLEAPRGPDRIDPETGEVIVGEKLWDRGLRLQGNQRKVLISRARFKQVAGGWRAGKSVVSALAIFLDMMWRVFVRGVRNDLWGVLADTYGMATEEMRHLSRFLTEAGIHHDMKTPENQSWKLTVPGWGVEVRTLTASDVTKIASRPYRGIVMAEAAQTVEAAWVNARGRVTETRGWVLLSGTFEATKGPWYHQLAESWSKPGALGEFYSLPTWENLVIYPGGREDPEILDAESSFPPAVFLEKFGGVPVKRSDIAMVGADERWQVRHRYPHLKTSYDPEQPVYLFSDPGIAHAYAVFAVQFVGQGLDRRKMGAVAWVIDAIYRWNRSAQEIIAECAARPWAPNVETIVMDFAARQRRAEGPPIIEQWAKGWRELTGQALHIVANPVPLQAGYDIHKRALLNTWPEDEANRMFNSDGKLRQFVDPDGPRLYFDPIAAAPMFGGMVDGVQYAGEYNLHRMKKNREGTVT